jgi:hypothetical protein
MKRLFFVSILLALVLVAYAVASCPTSVTCALDDQPMSFTGETKVMNGHTFGKYAHGLGSGRHEAWFRCD